MQYTTHISLRADIDELCCQDFRDTFVCNTQRLSPPAISLLRCFIMISKILLYAIHNIPFASAIDKKLCYQDFNEQFDCKSTQKIGNMQIYTNIFCYFCSNKFEGYTQ